jgi:hypothetical protein
MDREPGVALTYGRTHGLRDGVLNTDFHNGLERDLSGDELKTVAGINTLTTCFRNVFRGPPPPFLRQSPIGDLTVWAVLGYHGSGKFMADLQPTIYNMHPGGVLSMVSPQRQIFMTLVARLNIAAYHAEMGDNRAAQACVRQTLLHLFTLDDAWWILRRAFSNWRRSRRRRKVKRPTP